MKLSTTLFILCALGSTAIGISASGAPGATEPAGEVPELNQKVVGYAKRHLGEKVTDGQCTALVVEALRDSGARRFPFQGHGGDYVWGRPVASFREARPGDVVQFRDAVFRGKTWVSSRRWVSWHQTYPHHSAIISEVRNGGKVVVLLHQNVGPEGASDERKQVVTETLLRTDSLQKGGQVWIYRPVAAGEPVDDPAPQG